MLLFHQTTYLLDCAILKRLYRDRISLSLIMKRLPKMKNKIVPSQQTQQEATNIAKATQKQGQTKEQTKLIAQGIEKGIAQYKKQQKEKARQADKAKKKIQRSKRADNENSDETQQPETTSTNTKSSILPWMLLAISWIGFFVYVSQGM